MDTTITSGSPTCFGDGLAGMDQGTGGALPPLHSERAVGQYGKPGRFVVAFPSICGWLILNYPAPLALGGATVVWLLISFSIWVIRQRRLC